MAPQKGAPDFSYETAIGGRVAGIDEAGRGPWAGPVVAAAVILDLRNCPDRINDSKKLSARVRTELFEAIRETGSISVGMASVEEIDALNIRNATHLAMLRAANGLWPQPEALLIDGREIPDGLPCKAQAVIKGDARALSIAAASIIAKVTRDRIMTELDAKYPGYGWARNSGYGVPAHRDALIRLGVTPHHRRSFRPIHNMLC